MQIKHKVMMMGFAPFVALAGCGTLRVERVERSVTEPWVCRCSAERPVLSGEMASQQAAIDEWIATSLILFGLYEEPTIDGALLRQCTYEPEPFGEEPASYATNVVVQGRILFADEEYLSYEVRLDAFEHNKNRGVWSFSRGRALTLDDIFRWKTLPGLTDNFSINERGMEFVRNGFEVRGYFTDPAIVLFICWEDLKPYLKQDFKLPQGSNTKGK